MGFGPKCNRGRASEDMASDRIEKNNRAASYHAEGAGHWGKLGSYTPGPGHQTSVAANLCHGHNATGQTRGGTDGKWLPRAIAQPVGCTPAAEGEGKSAKGGPFCFHRTGGGARRRAVGHDVCIPATVLHSTEAIAPVMLTSSKAAVGPMPGLAPKAPWALKNAPPSLATRASPSPSVAVPSEEPSEEPHPQPGRRRALSREGWRCRRHRLP